MTELTTILQLLLLTLWCHGWHHLFSPGEALYFLSKWAHDSYKKADEIRYTEIENIGDWYNEQKIKETNSKALVELYNEKIEEANIKHERTVYFLKPLFLCSICFASIYGTGGYILLNYTTWGIFPVAIIALISVNKLFQKWL